MSRIGKKIIDIPAGVTITQDNATVTVTGPKGSLTQELFPGISLEISESGAEVKVDNEKDKKQRATWGLARSLIANMVEWVSQGFKKSLEIHGVGYKFDIQGTKLILSVGYSHKVEKELPTDVAVEIDSEDTSILHISGINKQRVGEVAAQIREVKKPEPYKGKGIRYVWEYVRRKAGKTGAA